jgi:outer membrane protein assembly factor BamB
LRNSHVQQKAICSTPPTYGAVLTELWSAIYPLGSGYSSIVGPLIDETVCFLIFFFLYPFNFNFCFFQGFLYIGTNNGIIKLHPFSGTQVGFFWTPSSVSRTFSVFDDRIVFGTDDGQLYSVRLDMTLMWNVSIGFGAQLFLQSSVVTDGTRLFFVSSDHFLRAIDASTGQPVWSYNCNPYLVEISIVGPQYDSLGRWSILVGLDYDYSTQTPARVIRLDSSNGTPIFNKFIGNDSSTYFTTYFPYVIGDSAYFGISFNNERMILRLNVTTGDYSLLPPGIHFISFLSNLVNNN